MEDSSYADARSLADLADAKIGAQVGTTSLDRHRRPRSSPSRTRRCSTTPTRPPRRWRTARSTRSSPTCRARSTSPPRCCRAARSSASSSRRLVSAEQFGLLFEQGNPLVDCVDQALDALEQRRHARRRSSSAGCPRPSTCRCCPERHQQAPAGTAATPSGSGTRSAAGAGAARSWSPRVDRRRARPAGLGHHAVARLAVGAARPTSTPRRRGCRSPRWPRRSAQRQAVPRRRGGRCSCVGGAGRGGPGGAVARADAAEAAGDRLHRHLPRRADAAGGAAGGLRVPRAAAAGGADRRRSGSA